MVKNSLRPAAEHALRVLAVAALALAAWERLHPAPAASPTFERADARTLPAALARWTAEPVPAVHAALDTLPDAPTRAWLAALAAASTRVTWGAAHAPALAASAEFVADPAGGVRVDATAPDGTTLAAADALGPLDSARAAAGGATFRLADEGPGFAVRTAGTVARIAAPRPPARLGAAVVLARAGWEGKFTAAALEERGWTVRTRFAMSPDVTVEGDPAPRLDTSAVAVVVALDSSAAALAPSIARYVRSGGGLVLAGESALASGLAALAAAVPALAPVDDSAGTVRPLDRLRSDAVPLAWRVIADRRTLVAAARRVGAGRVVQIGDEATWHHRLRADAAAPAAHRAWWAQVLAAAAYAGAPRPDTAPPASFLTPPPTDPAPLAATVATLGRPSSAPPSNGRPTLPTHRRIPDTVLIATALLALAAEVASRRLRARA
ncbi:hypothetical protein tb265_15280 [Gemmatimonadetes bacterium T265]|nr:hypothetical protein tb265_15280 [Gemmatimonadetes bacterium T265]